MRDDEKQMLSSKHEEADGRVFLHITIAIRNGSERVIICASDTDIVVMALFHFKRFERMGFRIFIYSLKVIIILFMNWCTASMRMKGTCCPYCMLLAVAILMSSCLEKANGHS